MGLCNSTNCIHTRNIAFFLYPLTRLLVKNIYKYNWLVTWPSLSYCIYHQKGGQVTSKSKFNSKERSRDLDRVRIYYRGDYYF